MIHNPKFPPVLLPIFSKSQTILLCSFSGIFDLFSIIIEDDIEIITRSPLLPWKQSQGVIDQVSVSLVKQYFRLGFCPVYRVSKNGNGQACRRSFQQKCTPRQFGRQPAHLPA